MFDSSISNWLLFAKERKVEELELEIADFCLFCGADAYAEDTKFMYQLPVSLLSNSSLRILKLVRCRINLLELTSMNSLEVLCLSKMSFSNTCIEVLLSAIPSLETLELRGGLEFDSLDIISTRLRKLVLQQLGIIDDDDDEYKSSLTLRISAPSLQSLEISGCLGAERINLIIQSELSSLVDVKLDFSLTAPENDEYEMFFMSLFEKLRHVKDLTIGIWCLQDLSLLEDNALPSPLSTLSCLTLDTEFSKSELPGIAKLLASSPFLKTLVIIINVRDPEVVKAVDYDYLYYYCNLRSKYSFDEKNYWSSHKPFFALALQNLKTVQISGFDYKKLPFDFVLFLLNNARQLEKMVIHAIVSDSVNPQTSSKMAKRIVGCSRCSPNADVLFS